MAESESDIRIKTDTPFLAPTGGLWGVDCEVFGENYRVITALRCILYDIFITYTYIQWLTLAPSFGLRGTNLLQLQNCVGTGARLNIKTVFLRYGDPVLKLRRSWDRLIFNTGIHILVRPHIYIERAPGQWRSSLSLLLPTWINWWDSPHKGQWRRALMFSLICGRANGWANNRGAGDLIRHRAHYDVTAMAVPAYFPCVGDHCCWSSFACIYLSGIQMDPYTFDSGVGNFAWTVLLNPQREWVRLLVTATLLLKRTASHHSTLHRLILYVLFFQREHKHIFTFYVIALH